MAGENSLLNPTAQVQSSYYNPIQGNFEMGTDGLLKVLDPKKATMQDYLGMQQYNAQFDTPYMDYAKMGFGGLNSIAGLVGTLDNLDTNKLIRKGKEQDLRFAADNQAYRTKVRTGTDSAFASIT